MSDQNVPEEENLTKDILESLEIEGPSEKDGSLLSETQVIKESDSGLLPWEENTNNSTQNTEVIISNNTDSSVIKNEEIDETIDSLEKLIEIISQKEYDYVLVEPEDMRVKITFRENNTNKNISYIKFPSYTNILLKLKQTAGLVVENTGNSQEGKGKLNVGKKEFSIMTKTAPGKNGERIWIKIKENTGNAVQSPKKKASLSMILGFFGAILFVMLILGGSFITFVVLNAKTVEDVKFFASLGINLNDINSFISQIVMIIFSILLFILTSVLSISLFKFFLTKKVFKRKKIVYGLLSIFLLFLTFGTASAWMYIDQKVKQLPNWQEEAYGDLKIFDNALLISNDFDTNQSLITETENLIGPVTLSFDLTNFQNGQERKGLLVKKYIWSFGGTIVESFTPTVVHEFTNIGNYEISVTAIGTDENGEEVRQELSNIPTIGISHIIDVEETITTNGGKKLSFNASSLESVGKVEWYFKSATVDDKSELDYPDWTRIDEGYIFIPGKIFFEDIYIGASLIQGNEKEQSIDKVFVIQTESNSDISGEIKYTQSLENELNFDFYVSNQKTNFSNGFIENYEWKIENQTYRIAGNLTNTDESPKISHSFVSFGEQTIEVTLTDSKGKTETLKSTVTIQKNVELKDSLTINDGDNQEIPDIRYEQKSHEYYINALGVPASVKFDARYVRPTSLLYTLDNVEWDVKNDSNIDATGENYTYDIPVEGNHIIVVTYTFVHRRNPADKISLKEFIYIEAIKKDAILNLKLEYDSNYAPVNVRFDASQSYIKNDDIIKFTYDYGDGVIEDRDAINQGHKYTVAGDYVVKLTVTGKSGKTYSTEKNLILLPAPQTVSISTSLKKAPVGQGIDFSSAESSGQIIEYFWDFGDGNISTEANPTHVYKKAGFYKVKLRADFVNKNSISDETEIEIIEASQ